MGFAEEVRNFDEPASSGAAGRYLKVVKGRKPRNNWKESSTHGGWFHLNLIHVWTKHPCGMLPLTPASTFTSAHHSPMDHRITMVLEIPINEWRHRDGHSG